MPSCSWFIIEDEHALDGVGDLRYTAEIALHDLRPGHAAGDLNVGAPVVMGVVPVGATGDVMRQIGIERRLGAVRWQVVDQGDAENISWLHAKRRTGDGALIGA